MIMTLMMTGNVENFKETRREKTENRGPPKRAALSRCPFKTFVPNYQI